MSEHSRVMGGKVLALERERGVIIERLDYQINFND